MINPVLCETNQYGGRAMTLGDMRGLGIRRLWISCLNRACGHDALLDASSYPAAVQILSLRSHFKCEKCGGRNVDVRPHWNERSPRPELADVQ
jgi:hypothetical protein